MTDLLIHTAEDVTGEWLSAALGRDGLRVVSVEAVGTGQMSQSHRVTFTAPDAPDATESVVVKLASDDPTSRATGVGLGAYKREISFYSNLAERIGGPLPACHLAVYDEADGWFTLVLQDITGASQGDQIAGCSVDDARTAMLALARLHAPVLGDLALGTSDWLNQPNPLTQELLTQLLPAFLDRYGDAIAPEHAALCERFVPSISGWHADARPPLGLVHGDYRLDNLLFGDGTCTVVDWQTVTWGPAMLDASYFLGGALVVEDRRAHEEELVRAYHDALLAQGVQGFSWEACWEEYRRQVFHNLLMAIAASMLVVRTDRGDEMFMTVLARSCQQAIDLDAVALLPEPDAGAPVPLVPTQEDDASRHEPGPEDVWNESWYFDAISDDGTLGFYVRTGRVPNQDLCLYTACITGPDRPSIMLVDGTAPLPAFDDDMQTIDTGTLRATQVCEEPLRRWRVTGSGTAASHADHAAPLRQEAGEPVAVSFDLVWDTEGTPFQWRQSSRYEIPCRVSGTITVEGEEIAFSGVGQRDHSWGARDWWAVDWMWSALHLDDGTHTHAVGVPQMPGYGVGYVQHDDVVTEITSVTATEEVGDDGLIRAARIVSGPDALDVDVEPVAFGAIYLEAPDGRVSHFPRAMCRVTAGDGRSGVGWVEWNRNQR